MYDQYEADDITIVARKEQEMITPQGKKVKWVTWVPTEKFGARGASSPDLLASKRDDYANYIEDSKTTINSIQSTLKSLPTKGGAASRDLDLAYELRSALSRVEQVVARHMGTNT